MTRRWLMSLAAAALLAGSGFSAEPAPTTWPQWRGVARDGVAPGAEWPDDFKSLKLNWKVENLGDSYSGAIVSESMVFSTETIDKKTEVVTAYDRKTGKQVWRQEWSGSMAVPFFAARNGSWIRSTPTLDGDSLYVTGIKDYLVCLNAKDGTVKWRFDFMKEFEAPVPTFGAVCSPLVDDSGVYIQAGLHFAKIDKKTGQAIWKTLKDNDSMMGSAFSSPVAAKLGGVDQVVVQTRTKLAGVDKKDGAVIWSKEIPSFRGMNILTPVVYDNKLFTSTYGGNTRLMSVDEKSLKDEWTLKYEGNMTTPVIVNDHVYLYGKDKRFMCIEAKTGKEKWRTDERFGDYWSLVTRGDKIFALDSRGIVFLIKANPGKYEQIAMMELTKEETWAHLAVVGDEVFVRSLKSLFAFTWKK